MLLTSSAFHIDHGLPGFPTAAHTLSFVRQFLQRLFSPVNRAQLLTRLGTYGAIMAHELEHDTFFNLEAGRDANLARQWISTMQNWLLQRAKTTAALLNMTLPPL